MFARYGTWDWESAPHSVCQATYLEYRLLLLVHLMKRVLCYTMLKLSAKSFSLISSRRLVAIHPPLLCSGGGGWWRAVVGGGGGEIWLLFSWMFLCVFISSFKCIVLRYRNDSGELWRGIDRSVRVAASNDLREKRYHKNQCRTGQWRPEITSGFKPKCSSCELWRQESERLG